MELGTATGGPLRLRDSGAVEDAEADEWLWWLEGVGGLAPEPPPRVREDDEYLFSGVTMA